jgi:hypothetical protein
MAVVAHAFPYLSQNAASKVVNLNNTDTLQVLLIASSSAAYTWNATAEGNQFVHDLFVTGSGSALTEVSGGSYSRKTLTSVTLATSGLVTTLTCANPSWAASTISATYAFFFDSQSGADTTDPLLCYWDFGGTQSTTSATFTLTISGSGLVTWTAS